VQIGFIGLGKMGANMVRRLVRDGHEVIAYNRTIEKAHELADEERASGHAIEAADSVAALVQRLSKPRIAWIMVPAGDATEAQVQELLEHLEPGDTIVDGGNSNFHDDVRRHAMLAEHGIHYVDAGVSGGVWGLANGYCLMVGGDAEAVAQVEPVFRDLAPEDGYAHVGAAGAGHFVKMVHNGIEYGLMQAYAEGFEVMEKSEFDLDLHAIAGIWRYGSVVRSWLLELLVNAFEAEGSHLEKIRGYVDDSGEGRWTIHEAMAEDVPVPVITAALFARFASRQDESFAAKVNAALRNQFGGHAVKLEGS
jgi:6-phosphogluconate dehydrogenase